MTQMKMTSISALTFSDVSTFRSKVTWTFFRQIYNNKTYIILYWGNIELLNAE